MRWNTSSLYSASNRRLKNSFHVYKQARSTFFIHYILFHASRSFGGCFGYLSCHWLIGGQLPHTHKHCRPGHYQVTFHGNSNKVLQRERMEMKRVDSCPPINTRIWWKISVAGTEFLCKNNLLAPNRHSERNEFFVPLTPSFHPNTTVTMPTSEVNWCSINRKFDGLRLSGGGCSSTADRLAHLFCVGVMTSGPDRTTSYSFLCIIQYTLLLPILPLSPAQTLFTSPPSWNQSEVVMIRCSGYQNMWELIFLWKVP